MDVAEVTSRLASVTAERDALAAQVQQLTFQVYQLRTRSTPNVIGVPVGQRTIAIIDARTEEVTHTTDAHHRW